MSRTNFDRVTAGMTDQERDEVAELVLVYPEPGCDPEEVAVLLDRLNDRLARVRDWVDELPARPVPSTSRSYHHKVIVDETAAFFASRAGDGQEQRLWTFLPKQDGKTHALEQATQGVQRAAWWSEQTGWVRIGEIVAEIAAGERRRRTHVFTRLYLNQYRPDEPAQPARAAFRRERLGTWPDPPKAVKARPGRRGEQREEPDDRLSDYMDAIRSSNQELADRTAMPRHLLY